MFEYFKMHVIVSEDKAFGIINFACTKTCILH